MNRVNSNHYDHRPLEWLPRENIKIDFDKSIKYRKIVEYVPILNDIEAKEINITFLSGEEIVIIHKCKYLIMIKLFLNSFVNNNFFHNYYYGDYIIELVINSDIKPTINTTGITLESISKITCIIKMK
jgi:hypothetical protein